MRCALCNGGGGACVHLQRDCGHTSCKHTSGHHARPLPRPPLPPVHHCRQIKHQIARRGRKKTRNPVAADQGHPAQVHHLLSRDHRPKTARTGESVDKCLVNWTCAHTFKCSVPGTAEACSSSGPLSSDRVRLNQASAQTTCVGLRECPPPSPMHAPSTPSCEHRLPLLAPGNICASGPHARVQWLEIKDGDDEKTIARKKKLIKSCKSKMRFQNMDLAQKAKADNWHNFVSGKGKKKKTGFFTGAHAPVLQGRVQGVAGRRVVGPTGMQAQQQGGEEPSPALNALPAPPFPSCTSTGARIRCCAPCAGS